MWSNTRIYEEGSQEQTTRGREAEKQEVSAAMSGGIMYRNIPGIQKLGIPYCYY